MLTSTLTYSAPVEIANAREVVDLATIDLNQDGRLDLVVAERGGSRLRVALAAGEENAFEAAVNFSPSAPISTLRFGDSDQDGDADVIAIADAGVVVFQNLGMDGDQWLGLGEEVVVANGSDTSDVLATDLNNDGLHDLVLAGTNHVSVLKGLSDRTFSEPELYSKGLGPRSVLADDLNQDGSLDLAVVDGHAGTLSILIGQGDGTFQPRQETYSYGGELTDVDAWVIGSGDIDHDQDLDLLLGQSNMHGEGLVSLFVNNGDGSFETDPTSERVQGILQRIELEDIDSDGDIDINIAHSGSYYNPGGFSVLPGDGTASLSAPIRMLATEMSQSHLADVNGDGRLDLLTADVSGIKYMLNTESDLFAPEFSTFVAGSSPNDVSVADVNGDKAADLVIVNGQSHDFSVLLGGGDATFTQTPRIPVGDRPTSQIAIDLNDDNRLDLVTANQTSNDISVLLNHTSGDFQAEKRYDVGESPQFVTASDVDADGDMDLVIANINSASVSVLLNQGAGTFADARNLRTISYPNSIAVMDHNHDSHLDLLVAGQGAISVLQGSGGGRFLETERGFAVGSGPQHQTLGDFDGDGQADLAVAVGSGIVIRHGQANRELGEAIRFPFNGYVNSLVSLDANSDGRQDILFSGFEMTDNVDQTVLLLSDPDNGFAAQPGFEGAQQMVVADWNQDGRDDVTMTANGATFLRYGESDGEFSESDRVGSELWQLKSGDFNGDGRPDLVGFAYGHNQQEVHIQLGQDDGTLGDRMRLEVSSDVMPFGPHNVSIGDWNGDGSEDLGLTYNVNQQSGIAFYTSNGDGTFTSEHVHEFKGYTDVAVSGDWNRDGRSDIAYGMDSSTIQILLADAEAGFQVGPKFSAGDGIASIASADIDGDGNLDLTLLSYQTEEASILWGRGDGSFETPNRLLAGGGPSYLRALDVDNNGSTDLVSVDNFNNELHVSLQTSEGNFEPQAIQPLGTSWVSSLGWADIDSNGTVDLMVTGGPTEKLHVFAGMGDGTFQASASYDVSNSINRIISEDFNRDGRPDVATSSSVGVTLYLGSESGGLSEGTDYRVGNGANALVSGDFDADGDLDLAVANRLGSSISVMKAVEDGVFESEYRFPVGMYPNSITLFDVDQDGPLDALVTNSNSGDISLLLGDGDGTFSEQDRYVVGNSPVDLAPFDFDGDKDIDLAVANAGSGDASLMFNNGDTTFTREPRFPVGRSPGDQIAHDLDGDGHVDLVVLNQQSRDVSVLRGKGDRTFEPEVRFEAADHYIETMVTGDVNADGFLDLAFIVNDYEANEFSIAFVMGEPNASFSSPIDISLGDIGYLEQMSMGDVDEDGNMDLAVTARDQMTGQLDVRIVYGNGKGEFQRMSEHRIGDDAHAIQLVDADADGHVDLLSATYDRVAVRWGNGDGTFGRTESVQISEAGYNLNVADLNGDAKPDLIVDAGSSVGIALAEGERTFGPGKRTGTTVEKNSIVIADLNGDAILDVAASTWRDRIEIRLGNGDGTFQGRVTHAVGNGIDGLVAGDFDGDGDLDLSVANRNIHDVIVIENQGEGVFTTSPRVDVGDYIHSIDTADLNHDGQMDLIVLDQSLSRVVTFLGNEDGSFSDRKRRSLTGSANAVASGDFDQDGHIDLAVTIQYPDRVAVILGEGDGSFDRPQYYDLIDVPTSIVAADFDRDGFVDLVTSNAGSDLCYDCPKPGGGISVLHGRGDGSFEDADRVFYLDSGSRFSDLSAADFDRDGDIDLVLVSMLGANILLNQTYQDTVGDINDDGLFDSSDLVLAFVGGKYEDGVADSATYEEGDWNLDGDFDSGDLVFVFQLGHYVSDFEPLEGQLAAAVDALFANDKDPG